MYILEDNVPLTNSTRGKRSKYPLDIMEIGQSFFVADKKPVTVRTATSRETSRTGKKFAIRTVEGGVRVWRIE